MSDERTNSVDPAVLDTGMTGETETWRSDHAYHHAFAVLGDCLAAMILLLRPDLTLDRTASLIGYSSALSRNDPILLAKNGPPNRPPLGERSCGRAQGLSRLPFGAYGLADSA